MIKILTVEQMRATEAAADSAGLSYATLMERAGKAVAFRVTKLLERLPTKPPRVTILAGKGNNGGDGLVAARFLKERTDAQITIFLLEPRLTDSGEPDPKADWLREAGVLVADGPTDAEQGYRVLRTMVANADVIIDAILGTGAQLPIRGELEKIMRQIHKALKDRTDDQPEVAFHTPSGLSHTDETATRFGDPIPPPYIIAVDIPTGLDADTGALDKLAIHADETITFEAAKPGLLLFPGADAVGTLRIASLGIPAKTQPLHGINQTLIDSELVRAMLPERSNDTNKGSFGKVMIVAGSLNYTGAPALAAAAAYRVGAGLVTVAPPQAIIPTIGAHILEATWLPLPHDMGVISKPAARVLREGLTGYTALLIGPGLSQEKPAADFLETFLAESSATKPKTRGPIGFTTGAKESDKSADESAPPAPLPPLVIDADGLNLLAKLEKWWEKLPAGAILTPHPGEMARLCALTDDEAGKATDKVQQDRIALATTKAAEWNQFVVLKGAYTVIAAPDGRIAVSPFATSALAKAGTGDVLAGIIVGLLGQGVDPFNAAIAGVFIQGAAGQRAAHDHGSVASVLAGDVVRTIGDALHQIGTRAE